MTDHHDAIAELSPVKRALLELRDTRARLDALERQRSEPIAVIGIGCWLPGGVRDAASYWTLLRDGVDAIREVPPERWNIDEYYDPAADTPGKMATRWGGFVDGIDRFDADFFGISPREAVSMDPQQRLLLTVAWEALEHAGQAPDRLNGSATGVFVGLSTNDYEQLEILHGDPRGIDMYLGTGGAHSVAAGRLSYILGLRGPSIAIDTACSSSLVATHLACQSLRADECRMALAGGVNAVLLPELTVALSQARTMAADGRCKMFDAAADGFVRGEGCGVLVLKRLADALADGDCVLALIRGSAVNQDGRSSGLTAPNGPSQEAVVRAALAMAGLEAAAIDYVEAHGTGTALGDPIEAGALAAVFGPERDPERPLRVGSVKTQIGHLESAAGVAGLIKVVLALQHGELPANLHFKTLSPHIAAAQPPIEVVARRQPWPTGPTPRRAGVSSFGFGGTNAHVILEEAPAATVPVPDDSPSADLLALSAKTPEALRELASRFAARLAEPGSQWPAVCYSANTGRAHFDHRLAVVAGSVGDAGGMLRDFAAGGTPPALATGYAPISNRPGIVFFFPREGNECPAMGRTLYRTEPAFRRAIVAVASALGTELERPLVDLLLGEPGTTDLLTDQRYAHPVLFAYEYALAELWRSWGVEPTAVVGHGLGEIAAAAVAGVLSLEDALALVSARRRLVQAPADGGAAGHADGPPVERFERAAAALHYREPRIPFIASLTGSAAGTEVTAAYWLRQARDGLRVPVSLEAVSMPDNHVIVELCPRQSDEPAVMLTALATMYVRGVDVDWPGMYGERRRPRVELPTYPFQAERYWHEALAPDVSGNVARRWSHIVDAGRRQAETGPLELRLETYDARWSALNRLTVEHMIETLRTRGAFDRPGTALDAAEVVARCGFAPAYRHLMARWLSRLADEGLLVRREDGRFASPEPLRPASLDDAWMQARKANADLPDLLEYMERCGRLLTPVLTGAESALETIFPAGDFRTGEFLYSDWALARYFNGIIRGAVEAAVASLPARRMVRAIELGAGTGGTTAAVLSALPPERTTYVYTDVSEAFFDHAGRKFGAYPFVRYGRLDVERTPVSQAVPEHAFDLVVAANVMHATRDLRASLANVRALVAPGGVLVLYEVTRHLPWFEMSVGLIEGWERFADDLRRDHPLLTPAGWAEALAQAGFEAVEMLPAAGSPAEVLGHHVILALAPADRPAAVARPADPAVAAPADTAAAHALSPIRAQKVIEAGASFVGDLMTANSENRQDRLVEFVRQHVMHVLRLPKGRVVDRRHRLMDLGLDSLMAVELRNRLQRGLDLPVPATIVFDHPTIEAMARFLDRELVARHGNGGRRTPADSGREQLPGAAANNGNDRVAPWQIADLPDEEVEAMLLRKLEEL